MPGTIFSSLVLHFTFVVNLRDGSLPRAIKESLEKYVAGVSAVCYLYSSCQLDDFR